MPTRKGISLNGINVWGTFFEKIKGQMRMLVRFVATSCIFAAHSLQGDPLTWSRFLLSRCFPKREGAGAHCLSIFRFCLLPLTSEDLSILATSYLNWVQSCRFQQNHSCIRHQRPVLRGSCVCAEHLQPRLLPRTQDRVPITIGRGLVFS